MIDMHIHILPGFDDGAADMEEALEMAWLAADSGVLAVIATSHAGPDFRAEVLAKWKNKYQKCLDSFREELKKRHIPLAVYPGMEILYGKGFFEALSAGNILTLNHSRYVLVEFFFDEKEEVIFDAVRQFKKTEYTMVMAHPERYDCVQRHPEILQQWKKAGIYCQLNQGSFFGSFGNTVKKTAEWLLYHGLVDVVASDAHDTVERPAGFEDIQYLLEDFCGLKEAQRLLRSRVALPCGPVLPKSVRCASAVLRT